jgi:hypothetical protein
MSNGAAFGVGVAVGFGLSLARVALWVSPLRPRTPKAKVIVVLGTVLVIPATVSFTMPTFITGLLVWLGAAAGAGVSTPIVLPLAYFLFRRKERQRHSSGPP